MRRSPKRMNDGRIFEMMIDGGRGSAGLSCMAVTNAVDVVCVGNDTNRPLCRRRLHGVSTHPTKILPMRRSGSDVSFFNYHQGNRM